MFMIFIIKRHFWRISGLLVTLALIVGLSACKMNSRNMKSFLAGALDARNRTNQQTFTGGPNWDWDQFSNGQFRCRNIANGRFATNSRCYGMPRDDDRWPG